MGLRHTKPFLNQPKGGMKMPGTRRNSGELRGTYTVLTPQYDPRRSNPPA